MEMEHECARCGRREDPAEDHHDFKAGLKEGFFCCESCASGGTCTCEEEYLLTHAW